MKKFYNISSWIFFFFFIVVCLGVFDVIEFNILKELSEFDLNLNKTEDKFIIYSFSFFFVFYLCLLIYYQFIEPVKTFKDIEDEK